MRPSLINKTNQHHVWRSYLESWSVNGNFFCLRDGRIFSTQPKSIAAQRYFYRAEELSENEITFIEQAFLAPMPRHLQERHRKWLRDFNYSFKMLRQLKENGLPEEAADATRTFIENNQIENIHTEIEYVGLRHLPSLYQADGSFFRQEESRIEFTIFLAFQYFRTTKMKANILLGAAPEIKKLMQIDVEKMWHPLSYILATSAAFFLTAEPLRLVILRNQSEIPFFTGDQPVVNTFGTGVAPKEQVQKLEFYYPVSPKIAVIVAPETEFEQDTVNLDESAVKRFNEHIVKNSLKEIYGCSLQHLEPLKA